MFAVAQKTHLIKYDIKQRQERVGESNSLGKGSPMKRL